MSVITKAQITTEVSRKLRGHTQSDEDILSALRFISKKADFLKDTQTVTAGGNTTAMPTGTRNIVGVVYGAGEQPLYETDLSDLLHRRMTKDNGIPTHYATWDNSIYWWPVPVTNYSVTLYRSYIHPDDVDNIEFETEFLDAVVSYVCYRMTTALGMDSRKQKTFLDEFNGYLAGLIEDLPETPILIQYNRLGL